MVNPSVLWDSIERCALSKSIDTAATLNTVSLSYILSVKRLQRTFGALHAKDPGLSCSIMMHHHMIHILMESVGCSRTNVPESTIELNKRQYILILV